ncbi:MAG: gamma-glutamyl-gamma-aminobutyrate hydrolase family protein [Chitinophagaceae bacterium]|nr:gamma-glutamyl-gamma-aminobutyrate hydrolase family protein [Chitinophagaceae bacterium]
MKIGITKTDWEDKHRNYVQWIKGDDRGNDDIEVINLSVENNDMEDCDAIVLTGGVDVHPEYYNSDEKYKNAPRKFKRDRDEFEMEVLKKAKEKEIPVLGICRGLQLINVFYGGSLVQDLGEKNSVHRGISKDKKHNVAVEKGTLLHNIVQEQGGLVNSAHHQSIQTLGNGLVANSYSEDGVIEGIEWKEEDGKPFMLAVQWHPERMDQADIPGSPFSKNIRDYFISRVKSNSKK